MYSIRHRWSEPKGYRDILKLALPLILSSSAWAIQHFVDRMFLAWYSPESIAAVMPAGILNFAFTCFFIGTSQYVSTFVAQYYGAKELNKIGAIVWQGIYLGLIGGGLLFFLYPLAAPIFNLVNHPEPIRQLEIEFFKIVAFGSLPAILIAALGGFFSGIGKTWYVLFINTFFTALTLVLDYVLIFGKLGFPELGIRGAAIANVVSAYVALGLFSFFMFTRHNNQVYRISEAIGFRWSLFRELIRYGGPAGLQFFLDVAGFSLFLLIVGRIGTIELASTNIAFNINNLVFLPMLGTGTAISILVGQSIGEANPAEAERLTYSGFHLTFLYMGTIAFLLVVMPRYFVDPFVAHNEAFEYQGINALATQLLRFVAVYSLFDALNIVFSSALRGAGDTRFVMFVILLLSCVGLIIPSYLLVEHFKFGIYAVWINATIYVCLVGLVFYLRFLNGAWKSCNVIKET